MVTPQKHNKESLLTCYRILKHVVQQDYTAINNVHPGTYQIYTFTDNIASFIKFFLKKCPSVNPRIVETY